MGWLLVLLLAKGYLLAEGCLLVKEAWALAGPVAVQAWW
jgi:hypothetical protein